MTRVFAVALLLISFVSLALADGGGPNPIKGSSSRATLQVLAN